MNALKVLDQSEALAAHKRLRERLETRRHTLADDKGDATPQTPRKPWEQRYNGKGSGGANRQAVRVRGQLFPSLTDAARLLKVHRSVLRRWMRNGIATKETK